MAHEAPDWFYPLQDDGHYVTRLRELREADGCYAIRIVRLFRRPDGFYLCDLHYAERRAALRCTRKV